MGPEHADRFAGLDQHRLVVGELTQCGDEGVERGPAARGAAGAAVDDEVCGVLGDLRVEVVHEHSQGRLLRPTPAGDCGSAGGADEAGAGVGGRHRGASDVCGVGVLRNAGVF